MNTGSVVERKKISVSDATLRLSGGEYTFREKLDAAPVEYSFYERLAAQQQ